MGRHSADAASACDAERGWRTRPGAAEVARDKAVRVARAAAPPASLLAPPHQRAISHDHTYQFLSNALLNYITVLMTY